MRKNYHGFVGTTIQDGADVVFHFCLYFLMELTGEALFLEELARGLVCEISERWLEFPVEELIS